VRRWFLLAPIVVLFVLAGIGLFHARQPAQNGKPAPTFSLPSLHDPNRAIAVRALRGHPLVMNFWASWCDPCKQEAPFLAAAAKSHPQITFLGVQILDGRNEGVRYEHRYGIPYESVRDARGSVAKTYGVTGVPETVFVDASGNVVGKYIGALDRKTLATILSDLVRLKPGRLLQIFGQGETRPVP
jgi:cytochrome c biogenesis protein CcmG/thiol:disulfide interchange protein DsbE